MQSRNRFARFYQNGSQEHILSLNAELKTSNLALKAAKKRHSQLKNLTRAICDDCWVILPTVSKEVQTVEGVFLLKRVQS